jgi:hypothetical protein
MNKYILDKEVQEYIKAHRELSPSAIALRKSPFSQVSSGEIAAQFDGWQRSVRKLPTWAFSSGIYYPDKINLEQCSSEHTALIKQMIISHDCRVVDITGGFGVDSAYLAQHAEIVVHCELNENLSEIVKHNAYELGVNNIVCLATDGVEYIRQQDNDSIDYIYVDPSRRVNNSKVFLLEDCEPNIIELQNIFLQKSRYVLYKLSPLLDISAAISKLQQIKYVLVISVDGDCKELLFVQDRDFEGMAKISAIRLFLDHIQLHTFTLEEEKSTLIRTAAPLTYLYDPDVSVTKAGAFKSIAKRFNLYKLHIHTHLYTSEALHDEFPGRVFQIKKVQSIPVFKKSNNINKANVISKNFPIKVDDIKKKFKIKDGGDDFLFFTTDANGNHIVIHAVKI